MTEKAQTGSLTGLFIWLEGLDEERSSTSRGGANFGPFGHYLYIYITLRTGTKSSTCSNFISIVSYSIRSRLGCLGIQQATLTLNLELVLISIFLQLGAGNSPGWWSAFTIFHHICLFWPGHGSLSNVKLDKNVWHARLFARVSWGIPDAAWQVVKHVTLHGERHPNVVHDRPQRWQNRHKIGINSCSLIPASDSEALISCSTFQFVAVHAKLSFWLFDLLSYSGGFLN